MSATLLARCPLLFHYSRPSRPASFTSRRRMHATMPCHLSFRLRLWGSTWSGSPTSLGRIIRWRSSKLRLDRRRLLWSCVASSVRHLLKHSIEVFSSLLSLFADFPSILQLVLEDSAIIKVGAGIAGPLARSSGCTIVTDLFIFAQKMPKSSNLISKSSCVDTCAWQRWPCKWTDRGGRLTSARRTNHGGQAQAKGANHLSVRRATSSGTSALV